ncbi:MAG: DinB family protein [Betaproteobacteria bacterium]
MKPHFTTLANYNAWANARIYAAARALPEESYKRNVGAFFGSLHGTLNHLLVADRIWMRRFTGEGDAPAQLNAILHEDLPTLDAARKAEDARIIRYVDELPEADFGKEIDYATTTGARHRNRLRELLTHLFNHQTHHRGQAHAILTVLGVREPPPLDLMVMLRER